MKRIYLFTAICIASISATVVAQRGPGGLGGFLRMMPLTAALDANEDGEITSAEMAKAVSVFKELDKDGNGKLTEEELRPEFGRGDDRGGRGGFGGPPPGFEGRGGPGGFGGEAPNTEEVVGRWLSLDKNKDEKLSKEELGERMQTLLARADTDKDGFASKAELAKLAESESGGGRGGPRGGGPGGGVFGGRGGGPEFGRGGRGRPEFGRGEPNPEEFVNRALEFDANKDGQLNKEELGKMGEGFGGRGFGGRGRGEFDRGGERGGRGRGGFGGERGGPRGGGPGGEARPQRPARPE